jgi:transcriptional regulator with XRE-family HTH domain
MPRSRTPSVDAGSVLRELRSSRSISQEELARRAGLSMTYISLIETGKRNPTLMAVGRILEAMNVTWAEFGSRLDLFT